MVLSTVLANDAVTNNKQVLLYSLPLAHMHNEIYSSCPVCLSVCMCVCMCVSAFSILPSRTSRCPTRGSSSYSMGNVVKLKLLSSKVYRSVINLCTVTKSSIFFMCNVSIYLSITRTEWECVIM